MHVPLCVMSDGVCVCVCVVWCVCVCVCVCDCIISELIMFCLDL